MKIRIPTFCVLMLGIAALFATESAYAANTTLFSTSGSPTWDTTSSIWHSGSATGTLQTYTNTTPSSITAEFANATGQTVTLAASTQINVNFIQFDSNGYIINGASGSSIVLSSTNSTQPTVSSFNTGTSTVNAVLAGTIGFQKGGSGVLVLGGANTYTGDTLIRGGTLSISSIGTTGSVSSNLGALATGTSIINFGVSSSGTATLLYTGAGETTTRIINMASGAAIIQNDGSGALNFTSNLTNTTTSGTRTFTLQGSNGGTFSGNIVNGTGTNGTAFSKAGTGTWTLSGINTYTGTTGINAGTLVISGNSAGATGAVTVNGGGTLAGTGTLGGSGSLVTVAGGTSPATRGSISLVDSSIGTLTLGGGLTIGSATANNNSSLSFEYGSGGVDTVAAGGVLTLNTGGAVVTLTNFGGAISSGTYNLLTYASETGTGAFTFSSGSSSVTIGGQVFTLQNTATAEQLVVTATGGAGNNSVIAAGPSSISIGRVMFGSSPAASGTVSLSSGTSATGYTITGNGSATPVSFSSANGAVTSGSSSVFTAGITTTSTGVKSGTLAIQNTGNDGSGASSAGAGQGNAQSPVSVTVSGTVVQNRVITSGTVNLGSLLVGVTSGTQTATLSTTGADTDNTRVTVNAASASSGGVTVATGTSTLFDSAGVTTTRGVNGSFGTSGTKNGSVGLSVTGEGLSGESVNPVNVGYTANVFQAVDSGALVTGTAAGAGSSVDLKLGITAPGDAGQRAAVKVTGLSTTNANFIVTTTTNSTGVATGTNATTPMTVGNVSVAANRLNGTYTYTGNVSGTTAYSDSALASQGTPATPTWTGVSITATIIGSTSSGTNQVYSAFITSGSSYAGYGLTSAVGGGKGQPGNPTEALLRGGTASADTTVTMAFSDTAGHPDTGFRTSDTLSLSGIRALADQSGSHDGSLITDTFVLQMTYDPNATGLEYIGWYDAQAGQWVNAIAGNSSAVLPTDYSGANARNESYDTYLTSVGGTPVLGDFGYSDGTAWAVLDHNSDFAVIPEPSTWGMILSGFGMLIGIQRLRSRRVGT